MPRPVDKLFDDILAAISVGEEIVRRGRACFDEDPVVQYSAETVVGHIGDAASKLPDEVRAAMPDIPWKAIIGARIMVDHAYHRLDYGRIWLSLEEDLPPLRAAIERCRSGGS
jgi:uncharacterized protein with HEPN domain